MNIGSSLSSRRSRFSLKGNKRLRAIGSVSSVLFTALLLATIIPVYYEPTNTEALTGTATESVLTFSSINPAASVNLTVNSPDGTFATSTDGTNNTVDQRASFSIATNNYTGYTVSISSTNASGELDHGTDAIDTIPSTVTATEFANNSKTNTDLNNTWGYIPNYYNSIANTTNYYPSSTTAATLNSTSTPNSTDGTSNPDTYTIGLGIRADYATNSGTYKNSTIVVSYIANPVGYTINYDPNDGNDGADVSNMPNPNPQVGTEVSTTINLNSSTPTHSNNRYTFKGWCSVEPASTLSEDCADSSNNTGTIYQPGDTYGIDKTMANVATLYALWEYSICNTRATTIGTNTPATDAICMQDMNDTVMSTMTQGAQYQLMDVRDNKNYYVAKMADGKVWMTQNLDLDLVADDSIIYDHSNTDLGWTTNDSTATWEPSTATVTTIGEYSNSYYNPHSYDPGDVYYYTSGSTSTDTTYNDLASCTGENESIHTVVDCTHYHAGNYYNWSAAVATNNTNSSGTGGNANYVTNYYSMPNSICPAGWRLPYGPESATNQYSEMNALWYTQNIVSGYVTGTTKGAWATSGRNNIRTTPLYMTRIGYKNGTGNPSNLGTYGYYWTSTVVNSSNSYAPYFYSSYPYPNSSQSRQYGMPVRCVARISSPGSTTFTYNGNGSDGGTAVIDQVVEGGRYAITEANTYTRTGYTFYSWNTQADGNGTDYMASTYLQPSGTDTTIDLYARWAMNQTITFDKNAADATCTGSTCADATTMNTQTIGGSLSANLLTNGYIRPGFVFDGWTTGSDGTGTSYSAGASYTLDPTNTNATTTLYAKWNPTITFNADNNVETMIIVNNSTDDKKPEYIASGGSKTVFAAAGTKYIVTVVPKAHYKLDSWTRDTNAGTISVGKDDEILLTSTYTVGNGGEVLTANTALGTDPNLPYTSMKDFTLADCTAAGSNVTDARDGKSYTVAKFGNYCYMLSNLRLDGGIELSSANSNINPNGVTYAADDAAGNSGATTFTTPTETWDSSKKNYYCKAIMTISNNEYYYNWYAAKANAYECASPTSDTNATATNDGYALGSICPLNWTLPTYSDITANSLWNSGANPGALSTSGYFYSGGQINVGSKGDWWSSAQYNNSYAYFLSFNGSSAGKYGYHKYEGHSVRCMRSSS